MAPHMKVLFVVTYVILCVIVIWGGGRGGCQGFADWKDLRTSEQIN
jgi:amino acid permease